MTKTTIGLGLMAALASGCGGEQARPPAQTAESYQPSPVMGTEPEMMPQEQQPMAGEEPMTEAAPMEQEKTPFQRYDADGDQRITRAEMEQSEGTTIVMTTWDSDGDGNLSPEELKVIFFTSMDRNGDQMIDKQESETAGMAWMTAKMRAQGQKVPPKPADQQKIAAAFQAADKNGDQKLDQTEAQMLPDTLLIVKTWDDDGDGKLSDTEVKTRIFAAWDVNDDGVVDQSEWMVR